MEKAVSRYTQTGFPSLCGLLWVTLKFSVYLVTYWVYVVVGREGCVRVLEAVYYKKSNVQSVSNGLRWKAREVRLGSWGESYFMNVTFDFYILIPFTVIITTGYSAFHHKHCYCDKQRSEISIVYCQCNYSNLYTIVHIIMLNMVFLW